jgi:quinol monooxygenase YgiN
MPSVIATIRVKEDKIEEAKALFADLAKAVDANEPGTLSYIPHQQKDDPSTFVFYEKYESDEAFKTHGANLAKEGARFGGILAGAPDIVFIEEI